MQRMPSLLTRSLGLCLGLITFSAVIASPSEFNLNLPKVTADSLIERTNTSIRWYREVQLGNQWISQPSDIYYWNTEHTLSNQILQTTFQSITAQVPFVEATSVGQKKKAIEPVENDHISQLAAERASDIDQIKAQIKISDTAIKNERSVEARANLVTRRSALQTQLIFLEKLRDNLQKTGGLLKVPGEALDSTTLVGQLEGLQQSIADELTSNSSTVSVDTTNLKDLDSGGLFARAGGLLALTRDLRGIDGLISATTQLQKGLFKSEEPFRAALRTVVQQGDQAREAMQSQDLKVVADAQHSTEKLSANFEKLWAALQPLQEAGLLIERSKHNLQLWHDAILHRNEDLARALLIKVITLFLIIVFILLLSEFWRRVTFKYVNDDRRRRQFLFIRRLVTGVFLAVIIIAGFVTNLSSLAAFTGILTVAIALALQTIILSIAAYFFIIGKHGLKVGDRITAGGALGEIVDIGLVRFYIKELSETGSELRPTGRIVTYPNSIIFQPVPLYKQMTSTTLIWHEIVINVRVGADVSLVKDKGLSAVLSAFAEYQSLLDSHTLKGDWILGLKIDAPAPYVLTRSNDKTTDVIVLFPVNLLHENQIDQLVIKSIDAAIQRDDAFKKSIEGTPCIAIYTEM